MNCNQPRPGFELVSPCPFPMTITITPRSLVLLLIIVSSCIDTVDYYLLILLFHSLADGFTLEFEWQQVFFDSKTLFRIVADLNDAVVWMVSSSPCINPSVTVQSARFTIGITVTFIFLQFLKFLDRVKVLSVLFQFYSVVSRDSKVHNLPITQPFRLWRDMTQGQFLSGV